MESGHDWMGLGILAFTFAAAFLGAWIGEKIREVLREK